MTLFKHGDKVRVAVSKTVNGMRRLRIDVRSPESELKESNHWIDTTICGDLSFQIFDPSDNTYLVNGVPGLFNGSTFWACEAYIKRPGGDSDGLTCAHCSEFYHMAEPNFEGSKLICFPCVDSNGWKYQKDKVTKLVTLR